MDDLLSKLLSFPPHPPPQRTLTDEAYDEAIKSQVETVRKFPELKLLQQTAGGENALDVINPALNTVPYAAILVANISAMKRGDGKGFNIDTIWDKLIGFLRTFDPRQARYIGTEFTAIIEGVSQIAQRSNSTHLAVAPIRDAILRLDPSGSVLTRSHLILARLSLESRNYIEAAPVLEKAIIYFPSATSNLPKGKYISDISLSPTAFITTKSRLTDALKTLDLLEYFIYSGMVFIGLRDWERALQCLESAVTFPTKENCCSKVMCEAYKKWILVGILTEGKLLSLPRSTSAGAAKAFHVIAKPYQTLAQIFESGSASRLKSEADVGQTIWRNDCNTGLVLHVLAAYQKFQIRALASVYSKISIPEIAKETTSAETGAKLPTPQAVENLVQSMISQGELHATLSNPPTGPSILTFIDNTTIWTEAQMQRELAESTERIKNLNEEIKQTNRMLTNDKDYIKYLQKQKKSASKDTQNGGSGGGATGHGLSLDEDEFFDPIEDEDLMGTGY